MFRKQDNKHLNEKALIAAIDQEAPPVMPRDRIHQQLFRFFFFGIFSTAVDFIVLNIGLYLMHMPETVANAMSISVALLAGYMINKKLVFRKRPPTKRHVGYFLLINLTGLYGLQTAMFILLHHYPLAQSTVAGFATSLVTHLPFNAVEANVAKLIATITSGIWNFILFRKFVFTNKHPKPAS